MMALARPSGTSFWCASSLALDLEAALASWADPEPAPPAPPAEGPAPAPAKRHRVDPGHEAAAPKAKRRERDERDDGSPVPHDREAERGLCSAMLERPGWIREVAGICGPDEFFSGDLAGIARVLIRLDEAGEPIDVGTLANELERAWPSRTIASIWEAIDDITGLERPVVFSAKSLAERVHGLAVRRRMAEISARTAAELAAGVLPADAIADRAATEFAALHEPASAGGFSWGGMDSPLDFMRRSASPEYLVEGLIVGGEAGAIGAPRKTFKTSIGMDLAISLASGTPFLNHFVIPKAVPVAYLSGESGVFALQSLIQTVCGARGIDLEPLSGMLKIGTKLPSFGNPRDVKELTRGLRADGIKLVIIDPLYLSMGGGESIDAANLTEIGPMLKRVFDACLEAGCTPIVQHHARKGAAKSGLLDGGALDLDDLAYSGLAESVRQWVLLNHRAPYDPTRGIARLRMSAGGSAGHGGEWAVDLRVGVLDREFAGRCWEPFVTPWGDGQGEGRAPAADPVERALAAREKLDRAADGKRRADAEDALAALIGDLGGKATARVWRNHLGWNDLRTERVAALLESEGRIAPVRIDVPCGRGVRKADGWKAVEATDGSL